MNIELFLPPQEVGKNVIVPKLTHGSRIVAIVSGNENLEDCDALITEDRRFSLGIKTADCAPICFSDGNKIGIAHVGWPGLCLGLIEKMLAHFDTATLAVYVGPFLHSFEIKKDFCYEKLSQKFTEYIKQQPEKLIFNFKDAIRSLLPPGTAFDPRNTGEDTSFPSYRRDKTKERFTTVINFSV